MSEISQTKERFLQYIDYKCIDKQEVFDKLHFSKWNFTGKSLLSELGSDKIRDISLLFPDISLDWLINGEGEMLRKNENVDQICNNTDNLTCLISILNDTLKEKDKQIDRLLSIIEKINA